MDARRSTKTSTVGSDDPVLPPDSETAYATHLFDLTADTYFGEEQLATRAFHITYIAGCLNVILLPSNWW